ncbi:hypothetical protein ADP8_05214 (plasmid) [Roseomonas mucosa]|nr:hypothetical protein ADP8_05214 [Roseomonas mucosa]
MLPSGQGAPVWRAQHGAGRASQIGGHGVTPEYIACTLFSYFVPASCQYADFLLLCFLIKQDGA